jgi:hypothetical protein
MANSAFPQQQQPPSPPLMSPRTRALLFFVVGLSFLAPQLSSSSPIVAAALTNTGNGKGTRIVEATTRDVHRAASDLESPSRRTVDAKAEKGVDTDTKEVEGEGSAGKAGAGSAATMTTTMMTNPALPFAAAAAAAAATTSQNDPSALSAGRIEKIGRADTQHSAGANDYVREGRRRGDRFTLYTGPTTQSGAAAAAVHERYR